MWSSLFLGGPLVCLGPGPSRVPCIKPCNGICLLQAVPASLVWVCSGTPSASEVMVLDVTRPNHVLDQFVLPHAHVVCAAWLPGECGGGTGEPVVTLNIWTRSIQLNPRGLDLDCVWSRVEFYRNLSK